MPDHRKTDNLGQDLNHDPVKGHGLFVCEDPSLQEETHGYAMVASFSKTHPQMRNRAGRDVCSIGNIGREKSLYRIWFMNDQPHCAIWKIPVANDAKLEKCSKIEQIKHPYKAGNLHMSELERDVHKCKALRRARELSFHCGKNPFSGPIWPVLWSDRNSALFFVPRPGTGDPHFERDGDPYTVSRTAAIVLL